MMLLLHKSFSFNRTEVGVGGMQVVGLMHTVSSSSLTPAGVVVGGGAEGAGVVMACAVTVRDKQAEKISSCRSSLIATLALQPLLYRSGAVQVVSVGRAREREPVPSSTYVLSTFLLQNLFAT